jgi:hypothetical protein
MQSFLTVKPEVLESLEKIMVSGTKGTHVLFSNTMIREAFERQEPVEMMEDHELSDMVQHALGDLLEFEDFERRQDYIESLGPKVRDLLVHLYFGFLDRFISDDKKQKPEVLH